MRGQWPNHYGVHGHEYTPPPFLSRLLSPINSVRIPKLETYIVNDFFVHLPPLPGPNNLGALLHHRGPRATGTPAAAAVEGIIRDRPVSEGVGGVTNTAAVGTQGAVTTTAVGMAGEEAVTTTAAVGMDGVGGSTTAGDTEGVGEATTTPVGLE